MASTMRGVQETPPEVRATGSSIDVCRRTSRRTPFPVGFQNSFTAFDLGLRDG